MFLGLQMGVHFPSVQLLYTDTSLPLSDESEAEDAPDEPALPDLLKVRSLSHPHPGSQQEAIPWHVISGNFSMKNPSRMLQAFDIEEQVVNHSSWARVKLRQSHSQGWLLSQIRLMQHCPATYAG